MNQLDLTRAGLWAAAAIVAATALLTGGCGAKEPASPQQLLQDLKSEEPKVEAAGPTAAENETSAAKAYRLARGAVEATKALNLYSATFEKQERVGDRLREPEQVRLIMREDPFAVRMTWTGKVDRNKRALYVDGENDDRLRVWAGNLPIPLTVNVAPDSGLALQDNRHPVTYIGLRNLARGLLQTLGEPMAAPQDTFRYLGREKIGRVECDVIGRPVVSDTEGDPSPGSLLYYLNAETHVPVQAARYDADGRLLERYTYLDLNTDPQVTDQTFDFASLGRK